ncbi:MAG TPA: hypothetical protein VGG06_01215 [Thermoanaerobaculia bacterium]|jgi:hypothetical protein
MDAGQTAALERRYQTARRSAEERQLSALFSELERLAAAASAVVNVGVGYAHHFLARDNELYAPYAKQVQAATRSPAAFDDHRRRLAVDTAIYAGHGSEITFAALTADDQGLPSYGPVHLLLKEAAIARRASVLEENSFTFVRRHNVVSGDPPPAGYLAIWPDRGRLAATKLEPSLAQDHQPEHLPRLLLRSEGDRGTDDFLEVHIYGTFNWQAVREVRAPAPSRLPTPEDRTLLEAAEVAAAAKSVRWHAHEHRMD